MRSCCLWAHGKLCTGLPTRAVREAVNWILLGVGSTVSLAGFTGVVWWLIRPRIEIWAREVLALGRETHKQVTVNNDVSSPPTMLDDLHRLRTMIMQQQSLTATFDIRLRQLDKTFHDHLIIGAQEQSDMWRAMEAIARATPPDDTTESS